MSLDRKKRPLIEMGVNSRATEFTVKGIAGFVNSVFVLLEAKAANLPMTGSRGRLPRGVFSMWPALSEALQTHAMNPTSPLLLLSLSGPFLNSLVEVLRTFVVRGGHNSGFLSHANSARHRLPRDVARPALFGTVTPQTGADDGQDVYTLESPTPLASSSQRNYADSSYTLPPLPPQICQLVPITGPVPCPNLVHRPQ